MLCIIEREMIHCGQYVYHKWSNVYTLDGVYTSLNDEALDEFLDAIDAVIVGEFDTYEDGSKYYD